MEFLQDKLTRDEWNNLEIPVSNEEKTILKLIIDGYEDLNMTINNNQSLFTFLKIDSIDSGMDSYLFNKYFKDELTKIDKKYSIKDINSEKISENIKLQKVKSAEMVKISNFDKNIELYKNNIFEYVILDMYKTLIKSIYKNKSSYSIYAYTINYLLKNTKIKNVNNILKERMEIVLKKIFKNISIQDVLKNAYKLIEKNGYLFQYEDKELFEHQKKIFNIFKNKEKINRDLVIYTAPTGTGKTMTPLGLSNEYKIIFVCVARHIGLALAKSAISMEKKIAFAFGSEEMDNIRLHNFSANSFVKKNDGSGSYIKFKDGKKKIDHSDGSKVEIMICDVKSYLAAMNFMINSNSDESGNCDTSKMIMYWDEPTITLDHEDHELHKTITNIWKENKIGNIILSSATMPKEEEMKEVINDYKSKFKNGNIHFINSDEYKKSIPIINTDQKSVYIHTMFKSYEELKNSINYIESNKTLLRYIDLEGIIKFITYVLDKKIESIDNLNNYFENDIANINMRTIKRYYLHLLNKIKENNYSEIYEYFLNNTKKKIKTEGSGLLYTTNDANTLTNGPTIFICEDAHKIAKFYIQQSKIPDDKFKDIMKKIGHNEVIQKKMTELEKKLEVIYEKNDNSVSNEKGKANDRCNKETNEMKELLNSINKLRKGLLIVNIDEEYVPNTKKHQDKYLKEVNNDSFVPKIDEICAKKIMELDISNTFKVLLLLGIGVFIKDSILDYQELMKKMATEQKLFIIIASSDYIYGTNYQFCHGIIGKDLSGMSKEKTIQSMGRIGRNNIQQDYTIRFRDNELIYKLFNKSDKNIEADNMNRLLVSQ